MKNNTGNTITIPTIRVKFDPVTKQFVTDRNSSITLKVVKNEDDSLSCRVQQSSEQ